jgi:hypothetical protein
MEEAVAQLYFHIIAMSVSCEANDMLTVQDHPMA